MRNAYLNSCKKEKAIDSFSSWTKYSDNIGSGKDWSFEKVEASDIPQSENVPIQEESMTSNIFSRIKNWFSKDLTKFWWKCDEQDKELEWWARAGRWVRNAESFRGGVPSQKSYLQEYEDLKSMIDRNYEPSPDDSIDTKAGDFFEGHRIQIEKDIDRTLTNHEYFGAGGEGQENLRTILKILALKYDLSI